MRTHSVRAFSKVLSVAAIATLFVVPPAVAETGPDPVPTADTHAVREPGDPALLVEQIATENGWSLARAELSLSLFFGTRSFVYGECERLRPWFDAVGLERGHSQEELDRVWPEAKRVARRESGCCPNTRGGDAMTSSCHVARVTTRSHRSDAGPWQINGVHYSPAHKDNRGQTPWMCTQESICHVSDLIDDPWTGTVGFFALWERSGWQPW
jgi:hypothetical protein